MLEKWKIWDKHLFDNPKDIEAEGELENDNKNVRDRVESRILCSLLAAYNITLKTFRFLLKPNFLFFYFILSITKWPYLGHNSLNEKMRELCFLQLSVCLSISLKNAIFRSYFKSLIKLKCPQFRPF